MHDSKKKVLETVKVFITRIIILTAEKKIDLARDVIKYVKGFAAINYNVNIYNKIINNCKIRKTITFRSYFFYYIKTNKTLTIK